MKSFTTIAQIILALSLSFLSLNSYANGDDNLTTNKIVDLKAEIHENKIYFNLKVLNETSGAYYSLVRFEHDTIITSVDIIEAIPNRINTPLLYSFNDEVVPGSDINYVLYQIHFDKPADILMVWEYNNDLNKINKLVEISEFLAININL